MADPRKYRIESIDLLRGMVMVLMALDHARTYFGFGSFFAEPTNLSTTTPPLFFTRWITHFCAPVFVFLAGTAAFLYGSRRTNVKEVAWFLFSRGMWLIFLEVTVVNFAWTFDVTLSMHILQVIWAIGFSMVCLSVLVFLPRWILLGTGIILVAGHNFLDAITCQGQDTARVIWYILHQARVLPLGAETAIDIHYPVIPWIGLMVLGYALGEFYNKDFDASKRKKLLLILGTGATALFLILRAFNIYGDPAPWSPRESFVFSVMSFINTTKYPPSLLFLLMTMGPSLIFLYLTEGIHNRVTTFLVVLGRVPLFFYVIHIYFIHLLGFLGMIYAGRAWTNYILTAQSFRTASLADFGFNLYVVYLVWIIAVASLFPLCKPYNNYKANNRDKWWLSYL